MRAQLHPSFLRAAASVLAVMVVVTTAAYFWQGYHQNLWWSRGYFVSLLIPFAIAPIVVCVAWVPLQFEFSETELTIQFPFRPLRTVPWSDLQYHGRGGGLYGLQFHTSGTFTFYPAALPRREWRLFKNFLLTAFPERKASGFIGARLFQWPWKKNKT
jgi:hypothetical protein